MIYLCVGRKNDVKMNQISDGKVTKSVACDNSIQNTIESEFVSDNFQTTDKDLEEVRAGMKILGIDSLATTASPSAIGKRSLNFS